MKYLSTFLNALLAGLCIAIGGVVYLSVDNKIVGALLFTVGLFTVVSFGFTLFTGKVWLVLDEGMRALPTLGVIWLGNLAGCAAVGYAVRATRIAGIAERAAAMCEIKLTDNLISIFLLAVLCNILMYVAVDGYKRNPHEVGKYIGLFLGVAVFILCGFEHCVANMFYFSVADVWSVHALDYLLVMTLGNAAGGILVPAIVRLRDRIDNEKKRGEHHGSTGILRPAAWQNEKGSTQPDYRRAGRASGSRHIEKR